jgi:hypothetical protein
MVAAACMVPPPDCTRTVIHAHSALIPKNGAFSHARAKTHETSTFERRAKCFRPDGDLEVRASVWGAGGGFFSEGSLRSGFDVDFRWSGQ